MVKRLVALFALLSVISSQFAMAANQKPPDVPTPVLQSATYASGTTKNKFGPTGTATTPDTPSYFATMPADIPTTSRTSWLATADGTSSADDCSNLLISCEAKFRSHLNVSHALYDDPIRNYGEPGTSHCHIFFGNMSTNAFSTFSTLRTRNESRAVGGRLNGTGYWAPCPIKTNPFGDGKNYAVKMSVAALYYKTDNSMSAWLVRIPRGLRYVGGVNMDDPEDTTRRREVIVANAQTSTSGRYNYVGNGFNGWQCLADQTGGGSLSGVTGYNGSSLVPYLNSTTGTNVSDPFLGNCKTNATSGVKAVILADFDGPDCWDGVNPWTEGGYNHVRYAVQDSQLLGRQSACPNGWYRIPSIRLELNFHTSGYSDYGAWRLASDDAMQTKLNALPACTTDSTGAYANAPCASRSGALWTGSTYSVPNGASFHTDWFGAWDDETFRQWQAHCSGVRGLLDGSGNPIDSTPHTCAGSLITPNGATSTFMKAGTPPDSSHNPIANLTQEYNTGVASGMFRIRTTNPSGMKDHTVH